MPISSRFGIQSGKSQGILYQKIKNILHDELKIVDSVHIFLENYYQMKKEKCQ